MDSLRILLNEMIRLNSCDFGQEFTPQLNLGANEDQILALETHFGLSLPHSYKEILRISDGVRFFIRGFHLLSISEIMQGKGHWETHNESYFSIKGYIEEVEEVEPILAKYLIATGPNALGGIFLDPSTTRKDGEMNVIGLDLKTNISSSRSIIDLMKESNVAREQSLSQKSGV